MREKDGKQQPIATLATGDYFGEMAVLAEVSRNATICARTAMDVLLIAKSERHAQNQRTRLRGGIPRPCPSSFRRGGQELAQRDCDYWRGSRVT